MFVVLKINEIKNLNNELLNVNTFPLIIKEKLLKLTDKILKENIILAGGNGFLGNQFSKFLAKKNYNVHVLDIKTERNKKNVFIINVI